jgi:hypothetical protein
LFNGSFVTNHVLESKALWNSFKERPVLDDPFTKDKICATIKGMPTNHAMVSLVSILRNAGVSLKRT